MNEWQYAGRVMSIVVIIVIYASIWVNILCQYNKPLPHDWCLEKIIWIFREFWIYCHVAGIICAILTWFIWSWI